MEEPKAFFYSLRIKITVYILIGAFVLSAIIIFVISYFLRQTLTDSLVNQGSIVAASIAEVAAEKMIEEDWVGMKNITEKYRHYLNNVYILVIDADYNIMTDSYNGKVPNELTGQNSYINFASKEGQQFSLQLISISNKEIFDIIWPIKEGLLGFVRVGLKKSYIDEKIQTTLIYIAIIVAIGTFAAILVSLIIITVQVTRPVIHLANTAKEISLGNFNAPINIKVKNELQILAAAIDRMRESLKTSLNRLKTRSTSGRF